MSETGRDPAHDFETLMSELESFNEDMARKPMIVLASKMDVAGDPEKVKALRRLAEGRALPFYEISSVTGQGIEPLKFILAERVLTSPGSGS